MQNNLKPWTSLHPLWCGIFQKVSKSRGRLLQGFSQAFLYIFNWLRRKEILKLAVWRSYQLNSKQTPSVHAFLPFKAALRGRMHSPLSHHFPYFNSRDVIFIQGLFPEMWKTLRWMDESSQNVRRMPREVLIGLIFVEEEGMEGKLEATIKDE